MSELMTDIRYLNTGGWCMIFSARVADKWLVLDISEGLACCFDVDPWETEEDWGDLEHYALPYRITWGDVLRYGLTAITDEMYRDMFLDDMALRRGEYGDVIEPTMRVD